MCLICKYPIVMTSHCIMTHKLRPDNLRVLVKFGYFSGYLQGKLEGNLVIFARKFTKKKVN